MAPPATATTVRVQDGKTLTTDGPYVETKEALDGFFTLEADDLDAAIEVASRVPAASMGGQRSRSTAHDGVVAILTDGQVERVFREQWGRTSSLR